MEDLLDQPFEQVWETILSMSGMSHCLPHNQQRTQQQSHTYQNIFYMFQSMGISQTSFGLEDLLGQFGLDLGTGHSSNQTRQNEDRATGTDRASTRTNNGRDGASRANEQATTGRETGQSTRNTRDSRNSDNASTKRPATNTRRNGGRRLYEEEDAQTKPAFAPEPMPYVQDFCSIW